MTSNKALQRMSALHGTSMSAPRVVQSICIRRGKAGRPLTPRFARRSESAKDLGRWTDEADVVHDGLRCNVRVVPNSSLVDGLEEIREAQAKDAPLFDAASGRDAGDDLTMAFHEVRDCRMQC
jgi:hypothetical protein